jgi:hypothetical protein
MGRQKTHDRAGRPASNTRAVIATDIQTGEEIIFKNYREAAKILHANRGVVFLCLDGVRKTHHGYEFRYADSY